MKIRRLTIRSFRGIPDEQSFNFMDSRQNPVSTLIFGDNGSGKSSIIDAIEYNLQGKIERSDSLKNEFRPSPISFQGEEEEGSYTSCWFSDDTRHTRTINVNYNEEKDKLVYSKAPTGIHHNFQIAPIVLRRNDIISYSTTPVQSKQLLLWKFIYKTEGATNEDHVIDHVQLQNLDKERIRLKGRRRKNLQNLAETLGMDPDKIPSAGSNDFSLFIKNNIRRGLNRKQYQQLKTKGRLKGVNEKGLEIASSVVRITEQIREVETQIKNIKKLGSASKSTRKEQIKKFFSEASSHLTTAFKKISPINFVEEINVFIGELTEVSFEIKVKLKNGKEVTPNSVFSEANLDLLILLLYTSLIKESIKFGQSKVLILDDVLQSVDSSIRLNFLEYLLKEFKDWQIIISAHDRLWLNQIRNVFRRNAHKFKEIEIFKWNFDTGPQILEIDSDEAENPLLIATKTKNTQIIASQTGLFLETICHKLSMSLNTSIQRKYEDKYTIGDLWPGIKKFFKKTELRELTQEIDKYLHIRNLLGAHYNEWAVSLSSHEVLSFSSNVLNFYNKIFCQKCRTWINGKKTCACGSLSLN
ncbi:AAA domain-containing protein [Salinimicrobium catena]|uniref:AAA domain-containing protein n=1 Tax=Salinimicrobium catena TaxID=390640 RepID=A0A1H5N6H2_9FLAO|nr:AAA family ATPase [Salinimicrobium catena]SDL36217.1 AAA domain-containing protein [Salinimicrobium catena]SEE96258.1 AAA domain-containing protein [Salinimicrobium catena]